METITEKDGVFYYYNEWQAEFGGRDPAFISTDWIFTDKELAIFQKWLDEKGETDD